MYQQISNPKVDFSSKENRTQKKQTTLSSMYASPVQMKKASNFHAISFSNNVIQRKLNIGGTDYITRNMIDGILGLQEVQKKRAYSLLDFDRLYKFNKPEDFITWLQNSAEAENIAHAIHEKLYNIIKAGLPHEKVLKDIGLSTTGILIDAPQQKLHVSTNFAVQQVGTNSYEGYCVTKDQVTDAIRELSDQEQKERLLTYTIILHTQNANLNSQVPKIADNLQCLKEQVMTQLKKQIKNNQMYFCSEHADTVLIKYADNIEAPIENPVIGISKAPCKLCAKAGVPGRTDDATSGELSSKYNIQLNNEMIDKIFDDHPENEVKGEARMNYNQSKEKPTKQLIASLLYYDSEELFSAKATAQGIAIKVPRWIPKEFISASDL